MKTLIITKDNPFTIYIDKWISYGWTVVIEGLDANKSEGIN